MERVTGLLAICLWIIGCAPSVLDTSDTEIPADFTPLVLGHRGTGPNISSNPYAENTMASFQKALEEGADGIELDVQRTSEGGLIVIHDELLDDVTTCTGCANERTLSELQSGCQALSDDGALEPLPSLDEVFDELPTSTFVDIEIKVPDSCMGGFATLDELGQSTADLVMDLVAARQIQDRVQISSYSAAALRQIKSIDENAFTGMIFGADLESSMAEAIDVAADAANIHGLSVYDEEVSVVASAQMQLWIWGINEASIIERLEEYEVRAYITDDPDIVAGIVR